MFYYLHLLTGETGSLGFFKAVTFRAAFAALAAFVFCLWFGPKIIAWLKSKKYQDGAHGKGSDFIQQAHAGKKGTPTMGGVILMGSALLSMALFARPDVIFVPLAFFTTLGLAAVGFYDDWIKLTRNDRDGLKAREKLFFQFLIGGGVGLILCWYSDPRNSSALAIPLVDKQYWPVLGLWYVLWAGIVVTGSSNAVNLTDGLDGLATVCAITVAVAFGLLAYFAGHAQIAEHLAVPRVRGAEELTVICAALAGGSLGFLWFNAHPAEVFMGDTGSLPLGGLVGLVALSIKQELLLVLVGGVFVMEALSVVIQVTSFKWTGKRVFLIAPLHHHFERKGWSETKIVSRFFILSVLFAVFSIAALRIH